MCIQCVIQNKSSQLSVWALLLKYLASCHVPQQPIPEHVCTSCVCDSQDERVRRGGKDGDKRTKKKKPQSPPSVRNFRFCNRLFAVSSHNDDVVVDYVILNDVISPQRVIDVEVVRRQRQEELLKLQVQRTMEKVRAMCPHVHCSCMHIHRNRSWKRSD